VCVEDEIDTLSVCVISRYRCRDLWRCVPGVEGVLVLVFGGVVAGCRLVEALGL
jgi:hypothetical protein